MQRLKTRGALLRVVLTTYGMYLNDGIMDPHRLSRSGALSKI